MPPAARVTDNHVCPAVDPISGAPHTGGPLLPPGSLNVVSDGLGIARVTDRLTCAVPVPDFVVTGSATVLINNLPAARMTDKTMHGGPASAIVSGSLFVSIGGPTVGAILGNLPAAAQQFDAAATGRVGGSPQQSYQNCGVESMRQLINQANHSSVTEDEALDDALRSGLASREATREDSGGTNPADRESFLAASGVRSTRVPATMAQIQQAVAEGRGVITSHDVAELWGPPNAGGHAIVVTGVEYDCFRKAT
jgi:uncharacterized Zn-binding protein involved in type VI secretion